MVGGSGEMVSRKWGCKVGRSDGSVGVDVVGGGKLGSDVESVIQDFRTPRLRTSGFQDSKV